MILRKILILIAILTLSYSKIFSQAIIPYHVQDTSALKSYFGIANEIYVYSDTSIYILCPSCVVNGYTVLQGIASRKWLKITSANNSISSNGLVSIGGIIVVDSNLTLVSPIIWRINGMFYTRNTDTTLIIHYADSSTYRNDLIYGDNTGSIHLTQGIEDSTLAITPILPTGTIQITVAYVYGRYINSNPSIIGVIPNWNQVMNSGNTTYTTGIMNNNNGYGVLTIVGSANNNTALYINNNNANNSAASSIDLFNNLGHIGQIYIGSSSNLFGVDQLGIRSSGKGGIRMFSDSGRITFGNGIISTPYTPTEFGAFETDGQLRLEKLKNNVALDTSKVLFFSGDTVKYGSLNSVFNKFILYANNGVSLSGDTVQLGGTLNKQTIINNNGFNFIITGSNISSSIQGINTSSGVGIYGSSSTGNGVYGVGSTASGVVGQIIGTGIGVTGLSDNGIAGSFKITPQSNSTINTALQVVNNGSNTTSNGFGVSEDFLLRTNTNTRVSNQLISQWQNATDANRTSKFYITGYNNAIADTLITLNGNGSSQLNKYGIGSFSGTPTYTLSVDVNGNIIETPVSAGGTVTSISTSYGLTGGTITTIGTIGADTTKLVPYTDTLKINGIATQTWINNKRYALLDSNNIFNGNNTFNSITTKIGKASSKSYVDIIGSGGDSPNWNTTYVKSSAGDSIDYGLYTPKITMSFGQGFTVNSGAGYLLETFGQNQKSYVDGSNLGYAMGTVKIGGDGSGSAAGAALDIFNYPNHRALPPLRFNYTNSDVLKDTLVSGAVEVYKDSIYFTGQNLIRKRLAFTTDIGTGFSGSLSGDVTGTQSATSVNKINGTSLASLSTGLLKNTTGTGVPSIAVDGIDYLSPNDSLNGALIKSGTLAATLIGTDHEALFPSTNGDSILFRPANATYDYKKSMRYDTLSGIFNAGAITSADILYSQMGSSTKAEPITGNITNANTANNLGSGTTYFVAVVIKSDTTISDFKWVQKTAGVFTANGAGWEGAGLYSVTGNSYTLIDSTGASDTLMWKSAPGIHTKSFTTTHHLTRGVYAIGILYRSNGAATTIPQIACFSNSSRDEQQSNDYANGFKTNCSISYAAGNLPPTGTLFTATTNYGIQYYLALD